MTFIRSFGVRPYLLRFARSGLTHYFCQIFVWVSIGFLHVFCLSLRCPKWILRLMAGEIYHPEFKFVVKIYFGDTLYTTFFICKKKYFFMFFCNISAKSGPNLKISISPDAPWCDSQIPDTMAKIGYKIASLSQKCTLFYYRYISAILGPILTIRPSSVFSWPSLSIPHVRIALGETFYCNVKNRNLYTKKSKAKFDSQSSRPD
jgi:hypothetical protein